MSVQGSLPRLGSETISFHRLSRKLGTGLVCTGEVYRHLWWVVSMQAPLGSDVRLDVMILSNCTDSPRDPRLTDSSCFSGSVFKKKKKPWGMEKGKIHRIIKDNNSIPVYFIPS